MTVSSTRKSQSTSKDTHDRYTCDTCDADITNSIRIKCAAKGCEEIDLCPRCFLEGREVGTHKAWHEYRVVDQPTYPIYDEDWGADEELMLLEGILASGLGDWQGVSDKLFGLRSKAEIEQHYRTIYLDSPTWPRVPKRTFPSYNREDFLARKRRRIKRMSEAPPPPPPPKPPTSGPANHEITGYMPGRLEFEHELVHEAEEGIADLHFGVVLQYGGDEQPEAEPEPEPEPEPTEDGEEDADGPQDEPDPPDPPVTVEEPEEVEVKLSLIKGYYDKLDKRIRAKQVVFQRGLLEYKKLQMAERKRPKEEREMYQRQKPFARVQTAEDFEVFVDGLMYETALKKRITELQQMRRDGLVSTLEVERYEKDKAAHAHHRAYADRAYSQSKSVRNSLAPGERDSVPPPAASATVASLMARGSPSAAGALSTNPQGVRMRKPPPPLNLANAHSLHLLTPAEQVFCSTLRILPKPFLAMKESLVREFARRNGRMTRREAREVLKIDVNKVGRIWDFLRDCGLLRVDEDPPAPPPPAPLPAPLPAPSSSTAPSTTGPKSPAKSPSKPSSSSGAKGASLTPPPSGPGPTPGGLGPRPPSALGNKPFAPSPLKNATTSTSASSSSGAATTSLSQAAAANGASPPKLARPPSVLGKKPPSGVGLGRVPTLQAMKDAGMRTNGGASGGGGGAGEQ